MKFLESPCTDPRWNLALEQYVFEQMDRSCSYFLLWQNANTIVVGKNQNTVQEINNAFVREQGITVVRRLSGGGAVYHDLGNLNFTFITDAENGERIDLQMFCIPIVETLRSFGVTAVISGRNDITVDGKKFSGNAQYRLHGRVMHHGTILFSSDLSKVSRALRVDEEKIQSKGIRSVASRVTNLKEYLPSDVTLQTFKDRLMNYVNAKEALCPCTLTEEDLNAIAHIQEERYNTWAWNYGRSPAYTINRSKRIAGCGQVEVSLSVEQGCLQDIQFFGDFFGSEDLNELADVLRNCPCRRDALLERLAHCELERYIHGLQPEELIQLITV